MKSISMDKRLIEREAREGGGDGGDKNQEKCEGQKIAEEWTERIDEAKGERGAGEIEMETPLLSERDKEG